MHEAERQLFGFTDADLGGALARAWDFPPPLADAVANHHLNPAALPDPRSLTGFIVRTREFARTYGQADGVEPAQQQTIPPAEWLQPPIASSLRVAGGIEGVQARVSVFLENALTR